MRFRWTAHAMRGAATRLVIGVVDQRRAPLALVGGVGLLRARPGAAAGRVLALGVGDAGRLPLAVLLRVPVLRLRGLCDGPPTPQGEYVDQHPQITAGASQELFSPSSCTGPWRPCGGCLNNAKLARQCSVQPLECTAQPHGAYRGLACQTARRPASPRASPRLRPRPSSGHPRPSRPALRHPGLKSYAATQHVSCIQGPEADQDNAPCSPPRLHARKQNVLETAS